MNSAQQQRWAPCQRREVVRSSCNAGMTTVFAFVFGAGLIACFVWYEAWSRADSARRSSLERASPSAQSAPGRQNQYSSTIPSPPHQEFV